MNHDPIPLPDPSTLPFGLIKITVWEEKTNEEDLGRDRRSWSGKTYTPGDTVWEHDRSTHTLEAGELVVWSYDGINLDYFNRRYLLNEEQDPGDLVRLGMWAFDRYAVDMGLKDKMDETHTNNRGMISWPEEDTTEDPSTNSQENN